MVNEVISSTANPERGDSDRKTNALRQFMRQMFSQNVDRQPLPGRRLDRAESVRQILSKRHTDVIQKTVELAAAQNLPVEANFEHRHEVKGESAVVTPAAKVVKTDKTTSKKVPKANKKAASATNIQKQRARLAAQKFVEPITTLPLVAVTPEGPTTGSEPKPTPKISPKTLKTLRQKDAADSQAVYDYRPAMLRSVVAAAIVGAAIVVVYVVR